MIVTWKARWILAMAFAAALSGISQQQPLVACFAIACLTWMGLEWLAFRWQSEVGLRWVRVERELADRTGRSRVLWAGHPCTVKVRVKLPRQLFLPAMRLYFEDISSAGLQRTDVAGRWFTSGPREVEWTYEAEPCTVGKLQFLGIRVVLQDLHGFFQSERFVSFPQAQRVLPWAGSLGSVISTRKPQNALAPPGVHRVPRAGTGSELLEIRDYVPGDSPRSIAWKVSAKRGALMCKQFESEVPVRCHVLLDLSPTTRLGYPGPCVANQLATLTATIADTLVASRDPVGVAILCGQDVSMTPPAARRKTVMRIVDRISDAVDRPLPCVPADLTSMLPAALSAMRVRHPQPWSQSRAAGQFWPLSTHRRQVYRLATLLAYHYGLGTATRADLCKSPDLMVGYAQRFLQEQGVPYAGNLFDSQGQYLFPDTEKVNTLSRLLQRAVLHGRDNELFVIIADLTVGEDDLEPLQRSIQVARSRHHRVVVVNPWPADVPPTHLGRAPLRERTISQQEVRLRALRHTLNPLRVPVVPAVEGLALKLILSQLELIRAGRVAL